MDPQQPKAEAATPTSAAPTSSGDAYTPFDTPDTPSDGAGFEAMTPAQEHHLKTSSVATVAENLGAAMASDDSVPSPISPYPSGASSSAATAGGDTEADGVQSGAKGDVEGDLEGEDHSLMKELFELPDDIRPLVPPSDTEAPPVIVLDGKNTGASETKGEATAPPPPPPSNPTTPTTPIEGAKGSADAKPSPIASPNLLSGGKTRSTSAASSLFEQAGPQSQSPLSSPVVTSEKVPSAVPPPVQTAPANTPAPMPAPTPAPAPAPGLQTMPRQQAQPQPQPQPQPKPKPQPQSLLPPPSSSSQSPPASGREWASQGLESKTEVEELRYSNPSTPTALSANGGANGGANGSANGGNSSRNYNAGETPWRGTASNGSNSAGGSQHVFLNGGVGGSGSGSVGGSSSGSRDGYRALVDDPESDGGEEIRIIRNIELESEGQVFVFPIVVAWIVLISVVGGLLIYALGPGDGMKDISLLDCIFLATSTVTASGLAPFAVEKLPHLSWVVLFCCMQLGSFSMLSLYPVFVRVNSLKKVIPPHLRTFDLAKYRRVPQWIVEYKALILLIRVVIVYQIVVYFIFILIIWARLSPDWESNSDTSGHCGCSAFEWAAFHGVSAYCNVGLSITSDSMVGIRDISIVSFALCMLVLFGNVLFPMFIRWIIIALSYYSKKDSSRKVYFRYLLFNGGSTYWNLFSSQHTWLLVVTQMFFFVSQVVLTLIISHEDKAMQVHSTEEQVNMAIFMSINTRHAGFAVLTVGDLKAGTVLIYLLMMFLAPSPVSIVLKSSEGAMRRRGESVISETDEGGEAGQDEGDGNRTPGSEERRTSRNLSKMFAVSHAHDEDGFHRPLLHDELEKTDHMAQILESQAHGPHGGSHGGHSGHGDGDAVPAALQTHPQTSARTRAETITLDVTDDELSSTRALLAAHTGSSQTVGSARRRVLYQRRRTSHHYETIDERDVDTRLLLMTKYPDSSVPWSDRVRFRISAVRYHLMRQLHGTVAEATTIRDVMICWLAWVAICCEEGFSLHGIAPFNALFEIVSCFGNVGLTLGVTVDEPDLAGMAFSAQVNGVSKIMFILVMIVGRTRGMPTRMDAAFSTSRSLSKDEILKKMEEEPETCGFIPRQTPGASPHLPGFQDRGGHGGDGGMDGGDWTREVRLSQGSR